MDWYKEYLSYNIRNEPQLWNPELFPVIYSDAAAYCVRLGSASEVWYADVDTGDTPRVVAPSLEAFLQSIAERFENGTYQLVEGYVEEV